jgi:hypothetical protein
MMQVTFKYLLKLEKYFKHYSIKSEIGIFMISWKKGNEPDLYGYRVYRANSLKEEFSQITKEPFKELISQIL